MLIIVLTGPDILFELIQFIGVIHAILQSGKQLQKLHIEDDCRNEASEVTVVRSALLRRLILTASSSTLTAHAAKLLSSLDGDAANQGNMLNLFIASSDQFPEVQMTAKFYG